MDRQRGKRRFKRKRSAATVHSKDFFSKEEQMNLVKEEGSEEGPDVTWLNSPMTALNKRGERGGK